MAKKKKKFNLARQRRIAKKKLKKLWANIFGSVFFAASMIFGFLIIRGTLKIMPDVTGGTLIAIGIIGLAVLGFFGFKK